jgi:hygromycin-B 7''-O-kinase
MVERKDVDVMGRADVYLQPQAADPVLSDDLVVDLVRRHVPTAARVVEVDESGGEARAYLVDDSVVVKTQRPHRLRPRTSLAKEAYLLDLLAPSLGRRIPKLLGHDKVDTDQGMVEYLCMTRIPGRAALHGTLGVDTRRALLVELGALLRALHATPAEPDRLPTDADAMALRQRLEYGFGDIADAFTDHDNRWASLSIPLDDVIGQALDALPDTATVVPVVLHSNPSPTHVFVDTTGRFTGLIDFGDSYASHPVLDLHRWPDPADRVGLHDGYLDGATADPEFHRMWTVAMIYTDLAVMAAGSPHTEAAATDLVVRLGDL